MKHMSFVQPVALVEYLRTLPFLGTLRANASTLEAGSFRELVLDYEVGASGIADGAWLKITFKFYSDWAPFQTDDPRATNYLSAEYQARVCFEGESPSTAPALKLRFDEKGHERPFQKAIIIDFVDGFLKPGDHVVIRLGDRRGGSVGTRVQTFIEEGFRFRAYVDPVGTSRFAAVPGDVVLDVVAGPPARVSLVGPRWVGPGEPAPTVVRVEDAWGNVCRDLGGSIAIEETLDGTVRRSELSLPSRGWATVRHRAEGRAAGTRSLVASGLGLRSEPALLTVEALGPQPRAYFADLHVHSNSTIGTNNTEYNLTYGRDVAGLDVLGYTANDFNITEADWARDVASCRAISVDHDFVCYPGTEWCGNSAVGGDHNVVFLGEEVLFPFDREGKSLRSFEWHEHVRGEAITPGAWPLPALYAAYAHDPDHHLLIPHVGGRRASLDYHHPELERLIEVGSSWGQFPDFYQEAIRRGYELGASAAGDEHRGRCGGGVPGTAVFGVRGGLTGVLAAELTRSAIASALRRRHTWATTGERLVALLRCGGAVQGDRVRAKGAQAVEYRLLGDVGFEEVAAHDDRGIVWIRNLHEELGFSERRIRLRWGGARLRDRYRVAKWHGTLRCLGSDFQTFQARGLEHMEEWVRRSGSRGLEIATETYGDADSVEMDLSNLAAGQFTFEFSINGYASAGRSSSQSSHPAWADLRFEFTGAELLARGSIRRELGGADLFVVAERITEHRLPADVAGTFEWSPRGGGGSRRPVYVAARQLDDSKVWTSPLFFDFDLASPPARGDR
jgi:hypothetical protein